MLQIWFSISTSLFFSAVFCVSLVLLCCLCFYYTYSLLCVKFRCRGRSVVVEFDWHHSIARPRKPPARRKDLWDISHTSRVIANCGSHFVAIATRVGRGKIWLRYRFVGLPRNRPTVVHMIDWYCDQVQARTQATTNDGWGNRSSTEVHVTLDGLPQAPASLTRTARNESCLSLHWTRPLVANGQITHYKVKPILHYVSKNIHDIFDCKSKNDYQILIILARIFVKQLAIKWPFNFPPHPTSACALPGETKPKKYYILSDVVILFNQNSTQNIFCPYFCPFGWHLI